jgi:hypothetical protein
MSRRGNSATRGARWPFRVQHLSTIRHVQGWGDWKGCHTLAEALEYIAAQGGDSSKWRVREERRTIKA